MKPKQAIKKKIKAFVGVILTIGICTSSLGTSALNAFPSASSEWDLGFGWTDYSTVGNIAFQNNNDQASYASYKKQLDGAKGFKISFQIDFPDPSVTSVARILLYSKSRYSWFFNILVTGEGSKASLDVGFCKYTSWTPPVVPNTGMLEGADGCVRITVERQAGSRYITFIMENKDGVELSRTTTTHPDYQGDYFLDGDDLSLHVYPYAGGNCFRFSGLSVQEYPGDGEEEPLNATEYWTMPSGWTDQSTAADIVISSDGNTDSNFYKPQWQANGDVRISFVITPDTQESTSLFLTIGSPSLSSYLRMDVTWNPAGNGTYQSNVAASLQRGGEYGWAWQTLGGLPWDWTGTSFRIALEWKRATQELWLYREPVGDDPNTIPTSAKLDLPIPGGNPGDPHFFECCGTNDMYFNLTPINGAPFTISNFELNTGKSAASEWTMPTGWNDVSDFNTVAVANIDDGAEPNERIETVETVDGFDIVYLTQAAPTGSTSDLLLTQTEFPERSLRLRQYGETGSVRATLELVDGDRTINLLDTQTQTVAGSSFVTRLKRQAGSSTLTVRLEQPDGAPIGEWPVTNPEVTMDNFYDLSPLKLSIAPTAGSDPYTVSRFTVTSYRRAPTEAPSWTLGSGWTAYLDDEGDLYFLKSDSLESEAVYRSSIDGGAGFKIQYDITFLKESQTTTYVKLGPDNRYFFSRIKGENGRITATGQIYNGAWTMDLLSREASSWSDAGRTIRVRLERQQGSGELHFILSRLDGTIVLDETICHSALDWSALNSSGIRFSIGRDSDANAFRISNVSLSEYPVTPVAANAVTIDGPRSAMVGDALSFAANLDPGEATIRSYRWEVDGVQTSTNESFLKTFDQAGDYTISLTAEDLSGNVRTASITLTVRPVPAGPGDVNLDGTIDFLDAQAILDHIVGLQALSEEQRAMADLNCDGKITNADATRILAGSEDGR